MIKQVLKVITMLVSIIVFAFMTAIVSSAQPRGGWVENSQPQTVTIYAGLL